MQALDIAAPPRPAPVLSDYAVAAIRGLNQEVSKARILGLSNGLRNLEVDHFGPRILFEEITAGWENSAADRAGTALLGVAARPRRKRSKRPKYTETKCDSKATKRTIVDSKTIYINDPAFYEVFQLEGHRFGCGGPAKGLDTLNFIGAYRLQCDYIVTQLLSDTFQLELIRFKVGLLHINFRTPDPARPGTFTNKPSVTFPIFHNARDAERELPANRKQATIESALTIPRWVSQKSLNQFRVHPNFLR
jgi:hypothetical protein